MSIQTYIYNPNARTHALLNPGGLQLGELQSGFLLSRSVPLLCFHCPRLSTAPLGPGCQSRAFDETVSAICFAEHKRICEQERAEEGRKKSRKRERMAALACLRDWEVICHLLPLLCLFSCLSPVALSATLPFLPNSLRCPLSLKRRPCQCRLAADYRCNHTHFRWSDRRKGLQIILTPSRIHQNSFPCRRWPTAATFILSSICSFSYSRPENSSRKAQLQQWPSKPILPVSSAHFGVM